MSPVDCAKASATEHGLSGAERQETILWMVLAKSQLVALAELMLHAVAEALAKAPSRLQQKTVSLRKLSTNIIEIFTSPMLRKGFSQWRQINENDGSK